MTGYIVSRNWGSAPWSDLYTSTGLRSFRRYFIAQFEFEPRLKIALGVRRPSCAFWVVHWKRRWCEVAETRRSHISLRNGYGTWACMRVGSMNKRWWTRVIFHNDQEYCKLASLRVTDGLGFMIEMVVQYQYLLVSSLLSWPLGRHTTTFHSPMCVRITRGIVTTKTFGSFLEGFFVIEG